ncbi:FMN-dependent NADH-azoreductase [Isoptericola sp. BMS4]|uniref:FMN-dependent NADH-azoreductase n=1 Tax=Isoptericola sp. BMS4 TaxID=2527875 RepID=UPI001423AEE0|nr:NAD(P)H-dependent oxidoreductase [Isoptericola sp. BMS4]
MTLLRLDTSIQGDRSASSALADLVVGEYRTAHPDAPVVTRHLGENPLPADAWALAYGAGFVPEAERTAEQRAATELATALADEARSAEMLVLAMPLYNYGVSQHAKTWIDLAIVGGGTGVPILEGKPVVLVTTRGGSYAEGTPREGWDHNTDYLRRILVDIWGADLTVVEREFTLVGINPALDRFAEPAAAMAAQAEREAVEAGRALSSARALAAAAS